MSIGKTGRILIDVLRKVPIQYPCDDERDDKNEHRDENPQYRFSDAARLKQHIKRPHFPLSGAESFPDFRFL